MTAEQPAAAEGPGPSVDPEERAYYERLAERWWDAQGPFWPLHRLNRLRTDYIRDRLCERLGRDPGGPRPLAGLRMLDIGCGGGLLSEAMAGLGARVVGIDPVEKNIRAARIHAARSGAAVEYRHAFAEDVAGAGERFDVVLNMEVVEHVNDLPSFLGACATLVGAPGVMFVATINRTPVAWVSAILGAEYILRWLPRGTHQWRKLRRPGEVRAPLEAAGLTLVDRTGVRVNPLNRHFALTRYMGINYMLMLARS